MTFLDNTPEAHNNGCFSVSKTLMKTILITGGAGFIGSHTTDLLLNSGLKVIAFDNLSTGKIVNLDLFNPHLEFIPGDILDYSALSKQIQRADAVLHLAALPSVEQSISDPVHSLSVNTQGFLHVLQAIRENPRSIPLVYASSAAIYGDNQELPCKDDISIEKYIALSPYALEKANNERYAALYSRLFGVKSLGLRYFNVYGKRQDPKSPYSGVIAKFIEQYRKQEAVTLLGDGKQSRDFIHVADIARANLLALESHFSGCLNIATGHAETLLNLISYIEKAGGQTATIEFGKPRMGDILHSYASTENAEKALGFRYNTSLADGIHLLME